MFFRDSEDEVDGAKEKYVCRNHGFAMNPIITKLGPIRNRSERHQILFSDNRAPLRYVCYSSIIDSRELMVRK